MKGRKDRRTAVPWPVPAGTDTHHSMRGPVTLRRFSLRMLGSAGGIKLCPLSHLHGVCRDHGLSPLQGEGCLVGGVGGVVGFFNLIFFFCFYFSAFLWHPSWLPLALRHPRPPPPQCGSLLLSPGTPQNRVRKLRFPRSSSPQRGKSGPAALTKQELTSP